MIELQHNYLLIMHEQAKNFLTWVKTSLPFLFKDYATVLDVGSGDINGNNRILFSDSCTYWGNDVAPGANVSIVSKTSALPFAADFFDIIVSSECFEHDPEYELSLKKIYNMLKPGGLFLFTCASIGRPEHGTVRTTPMDSFATIASVPVWSTYYKNLEKSDVEAVWQSISAEWSQSQYYYNAFTKDIYFWGIKPSESTRAVQIDSVYTDYLVSQWS